MKPRFIYIHGNGANNGWNFAFAPWLKNSLEGLGFETVFETFPDSILARSQYWLPFLKDVLKAGEEDVLIGWSSGAVASMRYAEDHKILGSILISPCYTDLGNEEEKISGFYDDPWNWQAIRSNQQEVVLVSSDNDPFIPQSEFTYIANHLGSKEIKIPGAKHFIERTSFPELLDYIKKTYG